MSCTWTATRKYNDYILLQGRGDTGVLQDMYRPTRRGTKVAGESVYIKSVDPANMTVGTTSPCSTGYLAGNQCNSQEALNKFLPFIKQCFDDCQWEDIQSDGAMMEWGQGMSVAALNTLMPLIYADMVANGSRLFSDATPTGAQIATEIIQAIHNIAAEGGGPGAVVLDLTYSSETIQAFGALYQPMDLITLNYSYGPGRPLGKLLGYNVYVTKSNLIDIAPTPDEQVDAIVFARKGFAYAHVGEGVGFRTATQAVDGTHSIVLSGCVGYGTIGIYDGITDSPLVWYIARADS